jgi:hypothetical protein
MKVTLTGLIILATAGFSVGQELKVTVSNGSPAPGETVVIEVNVKPEKNTKLSWTADGSGEFLSEKENQSRVQFRPTKPGPVVVICNINTPKGQLRPSVTLDVIGTPPAPAKVNPTPVNNSAPLQQHVTGDLALADMDYMVPSGFMGDAMAENNGSAVLDDGFAAGCRPGSQACVKIDYKPQEGKVGWAAFAWQRVTEGSANWGESPGADFSRATFRSLRVFAKGQPDSSGNLPKVQFKSGGNVAPKFNGSNRATYVVAGPTVQLTAAFKDYCLSLENRDLTNTVSPFTVVVTKASNPRGAVIVLDRVRFSHEGCQ